MLENNFVEKGTFTRLTTEKRAIRLTFGVAFMAYFVWQLPGYDVLLTRDFLLIPWGKWIGVVILFYFFSDVFNIGFNRRWGRWPQYAFLLLLGAAVASDWFLFGSLWVPPEGGLVYLMQQFTALSIGIGFLSSAFLASPG